jgi:putative transposase
VTVCVKGRKCALSNIREEEANLTPEGEFVLQVWQDLPAHYTHIELDEFVIMPNHVHWIIWITEDDHPTVGAGLKPAPTKEVNRHGLPEIVRDFRTFSARRINEHRQTTGTPFWQRGYHDHVIRDEADLHQHRHYIRQNPLKWHLDEYYRLETTYKVP